MKRNWWINVALLTVVIALALFAYFKPAKNAPAQRLSAIKASEVARIRIEIAGMEPIELIRDATDWRITSPLAAPADGFHVQRLLELLDATAPEWLPATGLARFDLNEPHARVTFDRQTFSFGAVNPLSNEQYVLTQDAIFLVSMRYAAALPKDALQLVSRQLFAAEEAPVAFEFKDFSLDQREGKWQLTPPMADVTQDDINRWVDEWRLATALAVQPPTKRKPLATIKLKLKTGGDITLGVLQRDPQLVLARSDHQFEYQFVGAIANRLLAPPAQQVKGK